ncbi:MAG: DUF3343 domain-containing protein [Syntrophales bacterium]|jgi:hypothetical protein|nr:DUF3343 domain-containing protein [Syntrophales bacterium]MDY0044460.1 DUF3343 domain-containing protein [Syntrophales bacterium]
MKFRKEKEEFNEGGIVLFKEVSHAIRGEKVVRGKGYEVKLVAPPPELRMGCDLALEINLVEQAGIERLLKNTKTPYVKVVPVKKETSELLEIVLITDFGEWIMAKAGNMKLTFAKESRRIVNISGGGCPDIPYLHAQLVGKTLAEAPRPRELGYTLCAMMLDRAFVRCLNI